MPDATRSAPKKPEILAPAGQPEAGYAALHYGADAVYLGLKNFSARAEAVNFSAEELARFVAFTHSLAPARKVYLAVNTLVREDELAQAAENLLIASEIGVDAVIIQDLGIAKLARERFPSLEMHASTQMAIHNLAGVQEAQRLGFSRVTMARELTLAELRRLAADTDVEIEAFIHGTLCYSYSGLCLFSSIATGRGGNRGRCVYSCREAADTPAGRAHPFSLKDMALGPRVLDFADAGIASLKIEGRKKSPLYVAATVDYYRRLLDGRLVPEDAAAAEARLQTIFARPWTRFFLDSRHNPDAADPEVVGHRGARIGEVDRVVASPSGPALLFQPGMPVERHDGLQVDIPGQARPYGFPVDNLYLVQPKGRLKSAFAAPAGESLAVALPPDAPVLSKGLPVYLSSSQEVKRSYPFPLPAASETSAATLTVSLAVSIKPNGADNAGITIEAAIPAPALFASVNPTDLSETLHAEAPAFPARDAAGAGQTARTAFSRMGGSRFSLGEWSFDNPAGLYIKPGNWNRLRRDLVDRLEAVYQKRRAVVAGFIANSVLPDTPAASPQGGDYRWSLLLDSPGLLTAFTQEDLAQVDEVALGVDSRTTPEELEPLAGLAKSHTVRLIAPLILRQPEWDAFRPAVARLMAAGWTNWQVGNLGALPLFPDRGAVDLAADWPLYIVNTMAARQLLEMGFTAYTLSPESAASDMAAVLRHHPDRARVLVYSDLPLFISAACAHAHLGLCRDKEHRQACTESTKGLRLAMEKSGEVEIVPQSCGSVVIGRHPLYLGQQVKQLKGMGTQRLCVDLRWRRHTPDEAAALWRSVRTGTFQGGITANFLKG